MAFYLKYRSRKISELDLESVRENLAEIVSSGNIPHAFLFSGPKGTGKTSAARILAKAINCEKRKRKSIEPCNRCDQCKLIDSAGNIDVIELDAASNRGIDDIRSLRDAVKLSPASAKSKVYVIDEAHMLTTEASNALLKTLEEPPEHVYFILATTNPEKLIGTIRSRTTEINFRKADTKEVMRCLARVVKEEKIKADEKALVIIAKAAGGSFRDAHKLLEQLNVGRKKLTEKLVSEKLETTDVAELDEFVKLLKEKNIKKLMAFIEKAAEKGTNIKDFVLEILELLKKQLLSHFGVVDLKDRDFDKDQLVELIELFDDVYSKTGSTAIEQLPLELAVVRWCSDGEGGGVSEGEGSGSVEKNVNINAKLQSKSIKKNKKDMKRSNGERNGAPLNGKGDKLENGVELSDDLWKQVLLSIRPKNTSTEALLRAAKPLGLSDDILTVGVFYNFHKERLEEHSHRTLLEKTLCEVMGKNIRIMCKLTEPPKKPELVEVDKDVQNGEVGNGKHEQTIQDEEVLTKKEDDDIVKIAEEIFG